MKILRGPRTTTRVAETATKSASEIEAKWSPGTALWFDGTVDKDGSRHTDIGVEIDESDVVALARAFLDCWPDQQEERDAELTDARARVEAAESAMRILHKLSWKAEQAPSKKAFGEAVRVVINHYESNARNPDASFEPPVVDWIDLSSLQSPTLPRWPHLRPNCAFDSEVRDFAVAS